MTNQPGDCDDQSETIALLGSPASYGIDSPVERIDTHAAMVFLAGDRAYKLKRAVRYSYLDFSTAERRKSACEAELRLNRRTAPELYLELRSVNRQADGTLGFGAGTAVDWLVVMARFAAGDLLENVAARGNLGADTVRALADHIARFHNHAEIAPRGDGAAHVKQVIAGNRESIAAYPALLPPADGEALYTASIAALADVAPLLDARAASGHVRRCHGDLHLANICLWRGRPVLFDALEFDDELACTDVLYDLAFLLMDLWERGLGGQASLLFNRYLDRRGESAGLAALPLFLSMRAAVRAHVSAAAAACETDPAQRAIKATAAANHLRWARAFLDRRRPRLIAIGGLSGTGKSTLAGGLAPLAGEAPGARWLRSDVLRKRLAGVEPETRLPAGAYTQAHNAEVYACLVAETATLLAAGQTVIADAVFAATAERADIAAVAAAAGAPFTGIWLEAPRTVLLDRVAGRRGDASDADTGVVERQLGYDTGPLSPWHRLDANRPAGELLARAKALIG